MTETEHTEVGGADVTPLDAILGSGSEPGVTASGDLPSQDAGPDDTDSGDDMVPLGVLKRVRERQKKDAARVKALEEEIQKYNDERWGFEEETSQQQSALNTDPDMDRVVAAYEKSYANFVKEQGPERVAEIDAALNRLNAEQRAHVSSLVGTGDVRQVVEYIHQQGLLFKPTSIQDALSGKGEQPPAATSHVDAGLTEREQAIINAERRTEFNACRVEFVSQYGKAKYDELDAACDAFMASGHPESEQFAKILKESSDPISAAAVMLNNVGYWSPAQQQQQQYHRPAPVMPSNFVAARSVGHRAGPAYAGPTPLNDIFARAR
jgi:hypothetical protein